MTAPRSSRFHLALLFLVLAVFAWSSYRPYERGTWVMEVAPVVIVMALLIPTYRKFPLTDLAYALIAFHAVVLMIGGKYTYARVPLFDLIRDAFDLGRNHYDRLGHFVQGFVPAMILRELLRRTSSLRPGGWLFALIVFSCLGFSAIYELIEWQAAVWLGSGADSFLGTQGDPWDTQKDMALAGLGAIAAQLLLTRAQERELQSL